MEQATHLQSNKRKLIAAIVIIVAAVAIALPFLIIYGVNESRRERRFNDCVDILIGDFGCDKVLYVGHVNSGGVVFGELVGSRGGYFAVGGKDGEEIVVAVPLRVRGKEKPVRAEWPFDRSFGETIAAMQAAGVDIDLDDIVNKKSTTAVKFYDHEHDIRECGQAVGADDLYDRADIGAVIEYYFVAEGSAAVRYVVTQEDGELIMYASRGGTAERIAL